MRISFSTLGCPDWSWDDMLVTAKDLGFDGIEIRGIENELYIPKALPFTGENLEHTKQRLERMHLGIPCLTSSCYLFDRSNIDFYMQEGRDCIDLAQKLGAPYIRVLGDANPEPGKGIDADYVAENLNMLADYADGKGIKVLIETNGIYADSDELAKLMAKLKSSNTGVLWDVHHPYRFFGEAAEKTYNTLKDHICFVHLKDSRMENGKVRYKMMGYGDVPVRDALLLLKKNGYGGYVSLEWVKRWNMDLEDPGIVFSHFINWVRSVV